MINIIVRSSKDADAVEAMIRRFYRDWNIRVFTLHGARTINDINYELRRMVSDDSFYLLLLGREEEKIINELKKNKPANLAIYVVPRRRVRNTRIEHLAWIFDIGKSIFRLSVGWLSDLKAYVFSQYTGNELNNYNIDPAFDVFLGIGDTFKYNLERILGGKICELPLLVRKYGGEHDIYCGYMRIGKIEIPDIGFTPKGHLLTSNYPETSLEETLKVNQEPLVNVYEKISIRLLEEYRDWADHVIVPWSGGKDSTATLIMALKVFPKKKIIPIYIDTGTEFPWTKQYVEEMAEKLGLELVKGYAGVDKGLLLEKLPMPNHDNRWCTSRKIEAIEKIIDMYSDGNILVLKGDRDAESIARSNRPPTTRESANKIIVTPIKLWSTAHVQLYILLNNIEMNPLYYKGFYRIGCYMCPALRSWELYIILHDKEIYSTLRKYKIFNLYIEYRMRAVNK